MIRQPAVADQFYPGNKLRLAQTVAALTPEFAAGEKIKALAVIVPHAGYVYSGRTAAATFARVKIPENVIILGPNHHGRGAGLAIMSRGSWAMPMGEVPLNATLSELIKAKNPAVTEDAEAHRFEHSLEVQVPFLQAAQAHLSISPLAVGQLSLNQAREAGHSLAAAIEEFDQPVLLVASTDMTHYQDRESAARQDRLALDQIRQLNPEGLYRTVLDHGISMCGFIPTTVVLTAALDLGATNASLIEYTDSGATSGDTTRVVAYAGLIIT
jgi:AmmeMemoRadiSam system protein B